MISEEIMSPFIKDNPVKKGSNAKIAIGVLEDYHTLGKKIVLSMMRAGNLAVIDYGHGLSPEAVAQRAAEDGIEYLCISTLMLHAAMRVKDLRKELKKRNCFPKIIVGGAPFRLDRSLWKDVGADAFCATASEVFDHLPAREEIIC
jgi:methanogenic corrinoid protein MtbC1